MFKTLTRFIFLTLLAFLATALGGWLLFWILPGKFLYQNITVYYLLVLAMFLAIDFFFWDVCFLRKIRNLRKKFSGYLPTSLYFPDDDVMALKKIIEFLDREISELRKNTEIILSSAKSLTSGTELKRLLKQIVELIHQRFPEESCSVVLLDDDGYLRIKASSGLSQDFVKNIRLAPGEGFAGKCFQQGEMVVVQDAEKEKSPATEKLIAEEKFGSYIHFPIINNGRVIGVFNVNSRKKNFFTPEIISVLSTLTEYIAVALNSASYYQQERALKERLENEVTTTTRELLEANRRLVQRVREVKVLADISGAITKQTRLEDLLAVASARLGELFNVRETGFLLYNSDGGRLEIQFPFLGRKKEEFKQTTLPVADKLPILSDIVLSYPYRLPADQKKRTYWSNKTSSTELGWKFLPSGMVINSLAIVPMRSPNQLVGLLIVTNKFMDTFTSEDVQLLQLIADRLGSLIESLQLYKSLLLANEALRRLNFQQQELVKKIGQELIVPVMAIKNILGEMKNTFENKKVLQLQEATETLEKMLVELKNRMERQ